jgi:hypothetical protein
MNWRESRAAYALFENDTIIPIGSDAELETLARGFADVAASEFHGAGAHLRNAGAKLTAGNYADSIRESIQAVESVARVLEPVAANAGAVEFMAKTNVNQTLSRCRSQIGRGIE